MASETITRNDLKAILNEVLPPTPSEYKKLLWTNPSPTSLFAAQTVSLDLSDYDEVEVVCKPYSSDTSYFTSRVKVGNKGKLYSQTGYGSPVRIYGTQRDFTPTSTGVAFGDGLDFSASVSNSYCVPYQIYGIRYGRVSAPQSNLVFGTPITISLDSSWIAPSDGIINLRVDWTSGSYGYYYVQNETDNTVAGAISNAGSLGGMTITTSFPVIQGKSYKKSMSAQVSSSVVTFYPFG